MGQSADKFGESYAVDHAGVIESRAPGSHTSPHREILYPADFVRLAVPHGSLTLGAIVFSVALASGNHTVIKGSTPILSAQSGPIAELR